MRPSAIRRVPRVFVGQSIIQTASGLKSFRTVAAIAALGLALSACGKKNEEKAAAAPSGQDVATVGSEPITTSELQVETRAGNPRQAPTDQDKANALLRIAARKSLAQRAVAQGLDRQPLILLEIRRARERILAEAVAIEAAKDSEKKLSLEKVNAFIGAHPYQFGKRAILQIHEIFIASTNNTDDIVKNVKNSSNLDQIVAYLDKNKIAYQQKDVELDTASLADPLVKALQAGNSIPVVRTPAATVFMQVTQSKPNAISGTNAEKLAREAMTRAFFDAELSTPGLDAVVTFKEPYKGIIDKQKKAANPAASTPPGQAPSSAAEAQTGAQEHPSNPSNPSMPADK